MQLFRCMTHHRALLVGCSTRLCRLLTRAVVEAAWPTQMQRVNLNWVILTRETVCWAAVSPGVRV
jgi:hypothetical protein